MEIERKFLLKELPFSVEGYSCRSIEQAYVSVDPVIRIRKQCRKASEPAARDVGDPAYILTCKGPGRMAREEWELSLTARQYDNLAKKAETEILKKSRYNIPLESGFEAELDVYESPCGLVGLLTVEVEFTSVEEAGKFDPPDWFGREVTNESGYSNSSLIRNGLPSRYFD